MNGVVSGVEIAQGDIVAVVRSAAEGEISDHHCAQAMNVDIGKCWMRLEMLHESGNTDQRHLTLVKRRKRVGRRPRVVALGHS